MSDNSVDDRIDFFGPFGNGEVHDGIDRAGNEDDGCGGDVFDVRFGICSDHFRGRADPGTEDDNRGIVGDCFRWSIDVNKRGELLKIFVNRHSGGWVLLKQKFSRFMKLLKRGGVGS